MQTKEIKTSTFHLKNGGNKLVIIFISKVPIVTI